MAIGTLIGAGLTAGAMALGNWWQNKQEQKNLQLQQENYDYQKELQQEIFAREDSSQQRAVADLKSAGLSPILAAGQGAAAGQAMNLTAPQRDTGAARGVQQMNLTGAMLDLQQKKEDISRTKAETERIKAQTANTTVDTEFLNASLAARVEQITVGMANVRSQTGLTHARELLALQSHRLAELDFPEQRRDAMVANMEMAWRQGKDLIIRPSDYGFSDGPDVRISTDSIKNTLQAQAWAQEIALTIAQKDANWYNVQQIAKLIQGGAQAGGTVTGAFNQASQYQYNRARTNVLDF